MKEKKIEGEKTTTIVNLLSHWSKNLLFSYLSKFFIARCALL
jgi:hypothetical protein